MTDMLRHFSEVIERAKRNGPVRLVVAAAQDEEALRAVKAAHDAGLAEAVLVGDSALIQPMLAVVGLPVGTKSCMKPNRPRRL